MISVFAFLFPLVALRLAASKPSNGPAPYGDWVLETKGPYNVSLQTAELVDTSRLDPFNSSHVRRLMVSRFFPVANEDCNDPVLVPYFPQVVADLERDILATPPYSFPRDIWTKFRFEVCSASSSISSARPDSREYPTVLFSPGLNTTRLFYSSLASEIASHGFNVVTIDHPYDVDVVEFPNGDVIYGGRVVPPSPPDNSDASLVQGQLVRADDASFVLDALNITRDALIFGHSFGGAAAATAMLKDSRLRGGVNLDGSMFGPVLDQGIGSPDNRSFILWGADGRNTTTEPSWGRFWDSIDRDETLWKRLMNVRESIHGSYWDLNIMMDLAGLKGSLSEEALGLVGPVSGFRIEEILGRYLPSYFRFALGLGEEEDIFDRPSDDFPEVFISGR